MNKGSTTIAVLSAALTVLLGIVVGQVYATANKAQDQSNNALAQISAVAQSNQDLDARLTRIENKIDNLNARIK